MGDLFSQSTYVRTWWVTLRNVTLRNVTLRNVTRNVVTYHRHRPYEIIYGDTFRYAQLKRNVRSLAMEMEVGDDGTARPSRLGY